MRPALRGGDVRGRWVRRLVRDVQRDRLLRRRGDEKGAMRERSGRHVSGGHSGADRHGHAALGLRVAGDERHVLVQRSESSSFDQGALAVVTLDASGHGTARELTTAVDFSTGVPRADFTANSTALYFVDGSSTTRRLIASAADGSGARTLASATVQVAQVAGSTLVYMLDAPVDTGNRSIFAVVLPNGTPVQLVAPGDVYYPSLSVSPSGTTVFVTDQTEAAVHELVQTATGATTAIGPAGGLVHGVWSPDGARFAYWTGMTSLTSVHVLNSDGTGDVLLTSSGVTGFTPTFSPDGTALAYGTGDASGNLVSVTVHSLAGGSDAVLSFSKSRLWGEPFLFAPDSAMVAIASSDGALAVAATSHSGAFVELTTSASYNSGTVYPCDWTRTHDYAAAIPLTNRRLSVAPTGGGAAQIASSPIDLPAFYEPVTTHPGLLAFTSVNPSQSGIYGSVALFGTNGAGAPLILPGKVLPAFTLNQEYQSPWSGWQGADSGSGQIAEPFTWGWLGSEIVYESDRDGVHPWFDIIAATDTVGTVGVIAPGAQVWAVRQGMTPAGIFYTRPSVGGVWFSMLPQTPGR